MESLTLRTSPAMRSPLPRLAGVHRQRAVALRVSAGGEPDLSVRVNGLQMPNPFVIGSGPPGTNYTVMKRAFDEGWGAVIAKTVSLEAAKVINVTPRYARLRAESNGAAKGPIIGWENIELISDRPLETMLNEFKQLKKEYPDRILIGSIMEEYNKAAWHELIERVEETGVDALEINFSCPHGMPERKMGAAVGQDCSLLEEVCGWINDKATVPVWAKMTPNITDITQELKTGKMIGYGKRHKGLISTGRRWKDTRHMAATLETDLLFWHWRLGYPSFNVLEQLFPNLFSKCNSDSLICDSYEFAKHIRTVYPSIGSKSSGSFDIVYYDVLRPTRITSTFGC